MDDMKDLFTELTENGGLNELPKNAVPLEFIVYYIKDTKGIAQEFVRLFKTDTGYEIRHCVQDDVLITLGENDITFGLQYADITGGAWAGIHMSSKDEELMPYLAMLHDAYKEEPIEEAPEEESKEEPVEE